MQLDKCPHCEDGCEICHFMGFAVPWEERCSKCEGSGYVDEYGEPCDGEDWRNRRKCWTCDGLKTVPTDLGDALLGFIKRHLNAHTSIS